MSIDKTIQYKNLLSKDEKLIPLLENLVPYQLEINQNICLQLCKSIMSQQLSTKVAQTIYNRFITLFEGVEPTPEQIANAVPTELRSIGLSNAKVSYVQNVAKYFIEKKATDVLIHNMTNDEVIEFLLPIKGVGRWTIEMLLMFTLGREDVFAVDDLGIQQSMIKLYNLDTTNKKQLREDMIKIAEKWSPYRTFACFYLWKFKDTK